MRPASTPGPRESRVLPHRPARAPATWESPGRPHFGQGPAPRPPRGPRPLGPQPSTPPRAAARALGRGEACAAHKPRDLPLGRHEAHLKDSDPHSHRRLENNDGSASTSERAPAGQPNALKDGGSPGRPCGRVGVASGALLQRDAPRVRLARRPPTIPGSPALPPEKSLRRPAECWGWRGEWPEVCSWRSLSSAFLDSIFESSRSV